ncbi:MAG: zinc-dependent alcohol dehydrogenase [Candidatus Latescibacterota bacterium]|jgi:threonine dehydrogenase-like Zn-dependent dehydrogenase
MKAAQLVAPRRWELIDVDKPQVAGDRILVRMEHVAICGSDKPPFVGVHDGYPLAPGATGHEGMGIVEACPSGHYREGDRVLLWGFDRGLFQEYVLATDTGDCIKLPTDLPDEQVLMSQLLGTVIHSFYKLGNIIDWKVVVLGQGPVGLLFAAVLRNLGATQIIVVDPFAYRLEAGLKMGATHAINSSREDPAAAVARITGGQLADLVVEAVGHTETFNLCPEIARRNAHVICFGIPDKERADGTVSLNLLNMYRKELRLITSVGPNPDEDYRVALDWIVQKRIDVSPVVSHVLPFADIQQGFAMAFDEQEHSQALKVVLRF